MSLDKALDERKAKTCSAARASEALKDLRLSFGRNTNAVIFDKNTDPAAISFIRAKNNLSARFGKAQRIRQQIIDHLL